MTGGGRAGAFGALAGLVAVGAAAGLAAERVAVGRARLAPDPDVDEPYFALPADRVREVRSDDGLALHVEVLDPTPGTTAPTVVFAHGWTQQLAVWHYQRQALPDDYPGRLVFYDQRSHGRSGRSPHDHATIDQLGRDLLAVLDACVPRGPVVLVGHSMGGMTIMALADQHPELFGRRIVGVVLMSTSTGMLAHATFGLPGLIKPVSRRVLPLVTRGVRSRPKLIERGRRFGTDLTFVLSRRLAFGSTDVSPSLVEFVEQMTAACPVDVIAEFYDTFAGHDKLAALAVLKKVPTMILVGSRDKITPAAHSEVMAKALPSAELVVVEGAGHMVQLERAALVTLHLRALLARSSARGARTA